MLFFNKSCADGLGIRLHEKLFNNIAHLRSPESLVKPYDYVILFLVHYHPLYITFDEEKSQERPLLSLPGYTQCTEYFAINVTQILIIRNELIPLSHKTQKRYCLMVIHELK